MIDRYRVIAQLKQGGMATLYLCERTGAAGFQKPVVIKVVHQELSADQRFIQMFIDEALLTSRIEHPNVVHVEELGEASGKYFIVMEYVHGASLSQLLRALATHRRRMRPELAVAIAIAAADGLHAAHEMRGDDGEPINVVHRDVSPENILISHSGHVKLIDFGVAKFRDRVAQTTIGGTIKGKVAYMAPEQARNGHVDRRVDIYQLGIVLWEMLTMRRCFKGEMSLAFLERVRNPQIPRPCEVAPGINPELDATVMRALSTDVDGRFSTAQQLRRALAAAEAPALAIDSSHLAELLAAMLGEELAEGRQHLPGELTLAVDVPPFDEEEVLKTLTIDDVDVHEAAEYAQEGPLSTPKSPDETTAHDGNMVRARRASAQSMPRVNGDPNDVVASDGRVDLLRSPVDLGGPPAKEHSDTDPDAPRFGMNDLAARKAIAAALAMLLVAAGVFWLAWPAPSWELVKPKLPKAAAVQSSHLQAR